MRDLLLIIWTGFTVAGLILLVPFIMLMLGFARGPMLTLGLPYIEPPPPPAPPGEQTKSDV